MGFNDADDAAVVRLDDGKLLLQTVDFFTPIVDDPYLFGQIAAANSLSDIYAMGGKPLFALNIAAFPINDLPKEMLTEILQGGADKAREAGIPIVGGHSIDDREPKYGLVVTGEVEEDQLVTNTKARPGDVLILTKPLGTGIIATAIKRGIASEESINAAVKTMVTLNDWAAKLMVKYGAHSATDITGFGLLGHLSEMCRASGVSAEVDFNKLQFITGAHKLAEEGIIPGGTKRNLDYVSEFTDFSENLTDTQRLMGADAQTSGGLLIALGQNKADDFISEYNSNSKLKAFSIGRVINQNDRLLYIRHI